MKVNVKNLGKLKRAFVKGLLLLMIVSLVPVRTPAFTWGTIINDSVTETIVISGVTLPITSMSVTFTNFQASRPADAEMLLVAPDGVHNLEIMSDAGGNTATGPITFTLSDAGATAIPLNAAIVNGTTYKPGDYGGAETFPGFAGTVNHPQTNGTATFATSFGGASGLPSANGTWTLIIFDDATAGEANPINSIGKWSLTINGVTATDGKIGGTVTDNNGSPLAGTVVNLSGTQNRKFITDASGNYRFDNVETNGFYTVRPSRIDYAFSPAERSFSQLGNQTEAAFTGSAISGAASPLDTPEYFVRQQYLDFLGREPDESGFNFWSDQVLACGADLGCVEHRRINVSAAYFLSIEFQATGGLVDSLYRASYGRAPRYSEFVPDAAAVGSGVIVGKGDWSDRLAANKQAFLDAWVQRANFRAAYDGLTDSQFVDSLVNHTGVNFSETERAAMVNSLIGGSLMRAGVLKQITEDSRFASAKRNEMFVTMEYFGYLRRDPDEAGYQFWLNKLNQFGGNFEQAEMVKAFIVSSEYRDRFPK